MCAGSDANTVAIILGSVFGALGFICILVLIWHCCCRSDEDKVEPCCGRPGGEANQAEGGGVELDGKRKDPEAPAQKTEAGPVAPEQKSMFPMAMPKMQTPMWNSKGKG